MSEENVAESFRKLYRKAKALGLTRKQLASLESVQKLRAPLLSASQKIHLKRKVLYPCLCVLLAVVAVPILSLVSEWPMTRVQLARLCFDVIDVDYDDVVENDWCLLRTPDELLDFFRPPIKCDFCRGVTSVDKVSQISPEEFEKKYAYSGHPVVVTDATQNWTAIKTFSFEFLKDIYKPDSPVLKNSYDNCQFFPYKTLFNNLGEVFNMSTARAHGNGEPWYIGWYVLKHYFINLNLCICYYHIVIGIGARPPNIFGEYMLKRNKGHGFGAMHLKELIKK